MAIRRLNRTIRGDSPELPSLPYEIRLIVPQKVFADMYGFDPPNIREQLYCGCIAADRVMSNGDSTQSMSSQCALRFPKIPDVKKSTKDWDKNWDSDVCRLTQAHKKEP